MSGTEWAYRVTNRACARSERDLNRTDEVGTAIIKLLLVIVISKAELSIILPLVCKNLINKSRHTLLLRRLNEERQGHIREDETVCDEDRVVEAHPLKQLGGIKSIQEGHKIELEETHRRRRSS